MWSEDSDPASLRPTSAVLQPAKKNKAKAPKAKKDMIPQKNTSKTSKEKDASKATPNKDQNSLTNFFKP